MGQFKADKDGGNRQLVRTTQPAGSAPTAPVAKPAGKPHVDQADPATPKE